MNEQSFLSWGLRVGSFRGIAIRIHWTLIIFWAFSLFSLIKGFGGVWAVPAWILAIVVSFSIILLHEFGHCFAARAVGGHADGVLLWPLGGLAMCIVPRIWRSQFIVAAGGPLVNVVLLLIFYPLFALLDSVAPAFVISTPVAILRAVILDWNIFLLIFNLIPLYPLDGGRMLQTLLWGHFGGYAPGAYGRASLFTIYISRVTAVIGIIFGLYSLFARQREVYVAPGDGLFVILIFVLALFECERLRRSLNEEEPDDMNSFGYDFSQGYTSLGDRQDSATKRRPSFLKRFGKIFGGSRSAGSDETADDAGDAVSHENENEDEPARNEEKERVDELLAKISREGYESLSDSERGFLEETGKRWAEK